MVWHLDRATATSKSQRRLAVTAALGQKAFFLGADWFGVGDGDLDLAKNWRCKMH